MKKTISTDQLKGLEEKKIEKALKTMGFLFPETLDEVKEFERIYGKTDVILPEELQSPSFLNNNDCVKEKGRVKMFEDDNVAMAAREGKSALPKEIHQKIMDDIAKKEAKKKLKK